MCKIMIIPGVNPQLNDELYAFAEIAASKLSENDPHGFGYAAYSQKIQDEKGNGLFGERWLSNVDAFNTLKSEDPTEALLKKLSGQSVKNPPALYSSFGNLEGRQSTNAIMLHARYATCAKNIGNTHPFVNKEGNLALIHNGVILNATKKQMKESTCDSEAILTEYQNYDVRADLENIKWAVEELQGWYAVGVMSSSKQFGSYIDVFKETQASLYVGWVDGLNAPVYCTSAQILLDTAQEMGMTVKGLRGVFSDVAMRIDLLTGELIKTQDFRHNMLGTSTTYKSGGAWTEDEYEYANGYYDRPDVSNFNAGWSEVGERIQKAYEHMDVEDPEAYISRSKVPHEASEGPMDVIDVEEAMEKQIERLMKDDERSLIEASEEEAEREWQAQVLKLTKKSME